MRFNTRTLPGVAALLAALAVVVAPGAAQASTSGLSALVSADCTHSRLQLVLNNQSTVDTTFTVTWAGRSGSPWTRTVTAGNNTLLYWTVAAGTAYTLQTTAPGFSNTQSGTFGCGLASGQPQMTSTALLTTSTTISGLNGTSGSYSGTVASVRIPALAVTDHGTIIMLADARVSSSADLPNNIQVAMRRSTDQGATWSPATIIHHAATTSEGTGDSSLLVDRTTNRVYAFYNYAPPGVGFNNSQAGSNSATDTTSLHVQYVYSDDDGQTWSNLVDLNPQVKDVSWAGLFASSGHGTQLSSGRLVQPIVYRDSAQVTHAADIYSDDHGVTWHAGGSAGSNVNESKAIERGTGAVVQNMRSNSAGNRRYATSTDGAGSFGAMTTAALIDPACNADELSYLRPSDLDSSGQPLRTSTALFSNPASTSSRVNLTVRMSTDDGASWPSAALLVPGTAGYSTMAVLTDGTVGDLYEIGDTGGIIFDRFTTAWVQAA